MSYVDIVFLAIALSIDACVVSFSYGLCIEKRKRITALLLALTTGFFQALMPMIAYFFTNSIKSYLQPYGKWIIFLIFMYLGITFIKEAMKEEEVRKLCVDFKTLFLVGVATSIDAFSAGITLSLTNSPLLFSLVAIGGITFLNSLLGYTSGYCLKHLNSKLLEYLGGALLIFLAIKALL